MSCTRARPRPLGERHRLGVRNLCWLRGQRHVVLALQPDVQMRSDRRPRATQPSRAPAHCICRSMSRVPAISRVAGITSLCWERPVVWPVEQRSCERLARHRRGHRGFPQACEQVGIRGTRSVRRASVDPVQRRQAGQGSPSESAALDYRLLEPGRRKGAGRGQVAGVRLQRRAAGFRVRAGSGAGLLHRSAV